jgi:ribose 5-phosphate isomerase A
MSLETLKKDAAEKAVEQVKDGMVVGLVTGSTTRYAIIKLGLLWQAGELTKIVAIPTSEETATLALEYDLPLGSLNDYPVIDLTIDGADQVDEKLNLVKGRGGALLREKIVATASRRFIVVVDDRKLVRYLDFVPIEVTQFAWQAHQRWLSQYCSKAELRLQGEQPFITDNGNYIIDCSFAHGIVNLPQLLTTLDSQPGIVEHGFFCDMAHEVIVASQAHGVFSFKKH